MGVELQQVKWRVTRGSHPEEHSTSCSAIWTIHLSSKPVKNVEDSSAIKRKSDSKYLLGCAPLLSLKREVREMLL